MFKNFSFAITNYISAFSFISRNKLNKFYLLPGIINIVFIGIFLVLGRLLGSSTLHLVKRLLGGNVNHTLAIFLEFLIYLMIFALYYLFYKTIILIILSPFLSYISEKSEKILTGKTFHFTFKDNIFFIKRGIQIAIKSFIKEIIFTMLILLLFFIPGINIFVPILLFILQSYYIGFSFIDYTLERHDYNTGTEVIRRNPVFFIVNGALFTLILFIPFFGLFIAPLVTSVACTTGTIKLIDDLKKGE